ncbi:YedE-related selenium metabolism membrane protein [Atopobacter sp. AH10]|uniref:YedE family putative selenium transporter n=1 Tax=Atopobacter sp. AH10 TaxID=2315861 RepID=UPI000EF2406A|nr:YedE family putative selenium transporter [Atopobacter sp. AH10]RLK62783.1 YedE-related selenium metabolism membrane protein [Atopobacter sp. AH10]
MHKKLDSIGTLAILGAVLAGLIALLSVGGNPGNMALCTACFIRDIMGALGLHSAPPVQYFRPEIVGIICGGFIAAIVSGEFKPTSSANPGLRFVGGLILMINALVFLGCTLRMVIRLAAGDLSAVVGLIGFIVGVSAGVYFLKRGFSLPKGEETAKGNGYVLPVIFAGLFILFLLVPSMFHFSKMGPGSFHANVALSLVAGLIFGAIAQKIRLCFAGAFRNVIMIRDFKMITPIVSLFIVLTIFNIATSRFALVPFGPIAHAQHLWNFLSMFAVGLAGILFGGCPVRQVVLAGTGHGDGIVTTIGMMVGAAMAHNFALASGPAMAATAEAPAVAGGPGIAGQIAVILSIVILFIIAFRYSSKK